MLNAFPDYSVSRLELRRETLSSEYGPYETVKARLWPWLSAAEHAVRAQGLQGYLAHKTPPPPQEHHMALGVVLLYSPREGQFLMSEVPLQVGWGMPATEAACASSVRVLVTKLLRPRGAVKNNFFAEM